MKRFAQIFIMFLAVSVLAACAPAVRPALSVGIPPSGWLDFLVGLVAQFPLLVGVAAVVAIVVNLLKLIPGGPVNDTNVEVWKNYLSLGAFVVVAILGIFNVDFTPVIVDTVAAKIAQILVYLSGFITVAGFSGIVHRNALRGLAFVGTSFSAHKK